MEVSVVTVAVPVRNGGALFRELLDAVAEQDVAAEVELLVCDSTSTDGSAEAARQHGAEVITISPADFSHGGTRNLMVERARGSHVAFLTQDAVPASRQWLHRLLAGFDEDERVALTFGPYIPRPSASQPVARELREWFAGFTSGAEPRIDELTAAERVMSEPWRLGPRRCFFTDANGCIAKLAWAHVPFRDVAYAEDQHLALDMLRAGYLKVYMPTAGVIHSHDYTTRDTLRRAFDEWRGLRGVNGWVEPISLGGFRGQVARPVRADVLDLRSADRLRPHRMLSSMMHHLARWIGALLGSRAEQLPRYARRALSLEGRQ